MDRAHFLSTFPLASKQGFYVIVERDEDGAFISEVPQLRACYSQDKTLDELMNNMKQVIELCLEEEGETCKIMRV